MLIKRDRRLSAGVIAMSDPTKPNPKSGEFREIGFFAALWSSVAVFCIGLTMALSRQWPPGKLEILKILGEHWPIGELKTTREIINEYVLSSTTAEWLTFFMVLSVFRIYVGVVFLANDDTLREAIEGKIQVKTFGKRPIQLLSLILAVVLSWRFSLLSGGERYLTFSILFIVISLVFGIFFFWPKRNKRERRKRRIQKIKRRMLVTKFSLLLLCGVSGTIFSLFGLAAFFLVSTVLAIVLILFWIVFGKLMLWDDSENLKNLSVFVADLIFIAPYVLLIWFNIEKGLGVPIWPDTWADFDRGAFSQAIVTAAIMLFVFFIVEMRTSYKQPFTDFLKSTISILFPFKTRPITSD